MGTTLIFILVCLGFKSRSIYIILVGGESEFLEQANKDQIGSFRPQSKTTSVALGINERQKFVTEIAQLKELVKQLKELVEQLKHGNGGAQVQLVNLGPVADV